MIKITTDNQSLDQQLDELKDKLLELIEEHNNDENNRKVEPVKNFGMPGRSYRYFSVVYVEEKRSSSSIGTLFYNGKFMTSDYKAETIETYYGRFKEELDKIPKMNNYAKKLRDEGWPV